MSGERREESGERGSPFKDSFCAKVMRATEVATEPFLMSDLIVDGLTLTGPERTAAFHILRDAVADGMLIRAHDGYRRVA